MVTDARELSLRAANEAEFERWTSVLTSAGSGYREMSDRAGSMPGTPNTRAK